MDLVLVWFARNVILSVGTVVDWRVWCFGGGLGRFYMTKVPLLGESEFLFWFAFRLSLRLENKE